MGLTAMVATMSQDCVDPVGRLFIAERPLRLICGTAAEAAPIGSYTLPSDFVTFGAFQRGGVAFRTELPPEPPISAGEPSR